MTAFAPVALLFSALGLIAISIIIFWERIAAAAHSSVESYAAELERAAIPVSRDTLSQVAMGIGAAVLIPWGILALLFHMPPQNALLLLVFFALLGYLGIRSYIRYRIATRLAAFNDQLEIVLRLIVSALRVGLGFRQSLSMIINDLPEPASVEFRRVLAQTTIGVGVNDALDQLAKRMPSAEIMMVTRAIGIQSQTGGNLAGILINLAETIKQRRRIERRIKTLTSEARSSKYIMTGLPICISILIMTVQPPMREALLFTPVGHFVFFLAILLMTAGWFTFNALSRLDI